MNAPYQSPWRAANPEGWPQLFDTNLAMVEKLILETKKTQLCHAVYDLDGTLFDVNHRSLGIIDEWLTSKDALEHDGPVVAQLRQLRIHHVGYSVADTFTNLGFNLTDPEVNAVFNSVHKQWKARFFDGKSLLDFDEPHVGAVAFVNRMVGLGVLPIYLSGRAKPSMEEGTRYQLERAGFPLEQAHIVLKPDSEWEDTLFKPEAFKHLSSEYEVLANFENEYANLGPMAQAYPHCIHILVDAPHSSKPIPPNANAVYRIPGFQL